MQQAIELLSFEVVCSGIPVALPCPLETVGTGSLAHTAGRKQSWTKNVEEGMVRRQNGTVKSSKRVQGMVLLGKQADNNADGLWAFLPNIKEKISMVLGCKWVACEGDEFQNVCLGRRISPWECVPPRCRRWSRARGQLDGSWRPSLCLLKGGSPRKPGCPVARTRCPERAWLGSECSHQ